MYCIYIFYCFLRKYTQIHDILSNLEPKIGENCRLLVKQAKSEKCMVSVNPTFRGWGSYVVDVLKYTHLL